MRIDKTKEAFRDACCLDAQSRDNERRHFNFPKWHALRNYPQFIRLFGSAVGYTTGVGEVWHITWLKQFFKQTNKQNGFEIQILHHNIRELNMLAREDNLSHDSSHPATQADWDSRCKVNQVSRAKTLTEQHWNLDLDELKRVQESRLSEKVWCCASTAARDAEIPDFVDVLAVFIRQQRSAEEEVDRTNFGREKDSSWAAAYLIKIHGSVTAWKRTWKNGGDIDRLEKDRILCVPDWQNEGFWRRDYVWIQEYPLEAKNRRGNSFPWEDRMVGQLQLLFTIWDKGQRNARGDHPYYTRAMVELLQWKDHGNIHPTHGMIEVFFFLSFFFLFIVYIQPVGL